MLSGFVLDEHLRRRLWRAIQAHNARGVDPLDVVRVGDPPDLPFGSSDAAILLWAERHRRILVSLDRSTMARHLAEHLQAGHHAPGIFLVRLKGNPAEVIEHLVLAVYASDPSEWQDWITLRTPASAPMIRRLGSPSSKTARRPDIFAFLLRR